MKKIQLSLLFFLATLVTIAYFTLDKKDQAYNTTGADTLSGNGDGVSEGTNNNAPREYDVKGVKFVMVPVEGGTFTIEEGSYFDAHSMKLSSYYIGQTEVTQALWTAVMGSNPSWFKGDNLPVESVSWDDCQEFIKKLNSITGKRFRLPIEAEWEYAAKGGKKSKGYKYSGSDNIDDVAWYWMNSKVKTHLVGTKTPNELGIYDMSGNVWEWCQDRYSGFRSGRYSRSTCELRVCRGGSWFNFARHCRSSKSDTFKRSGSFFSIGLRLVYE